MRVGSLLRHCGAVTSAAIDRALLDQQFSHRRIGAELLSSGAIAEETLLKALASQGGVRYLTSIDATCVREAPGGLSRDAIRALGVVPFREPEAGRLRVACGAPVPRVSLSVLGQLTGFVIEPFLVSDHALEHLIDNYGRTKQPRQVAEFVKASGLADAAARIASQAGRGKSLTLTEAVCLPHVWVRVKVDGAVRDMLVDYGGDETRKVA
jgi:hypothetical protein